MENKASGSPERDEMVEKYTILSQKSDSLRRRLSISSEPDYNSPITPTAFSPLTPFTSNPTTTETANSTYPLPSTWTTTSTDTTDEASLHEITQQIKTTLTELLNHESVKHDKMCRTWVQARLMDAEHELKKQRKRRNSSSGGMAQETMRALEWRQGAASAAAEFSGWGVEI